MKKNIAVKIVSVLLTLAMLSAIVLAQSPTSPNTNTPSDGSSPALDKGIGKLPSPAILPTSGLYGVKLAMERLKNVFLTKTGKAEYGLKRAMYRLAEAEKLREKNEEDLADLTEGHAQIIIENAQKHIDGIKDENKAQTLRDNTRQNIEVITALIAKREASGKTNGLKGLRNALDQFQKQANKKMVEKRSERETKEKAQNAKETAQQVAQNAKNNADKTEMSTKSVAQNAPAPASSVAQNEQTTNLTAPTTTPTNPNSCTQNTDCTPSTCCHATSCVTQSQKPDCSTTMCSQDCQYGTLDCGGQCECVIGQCRAMPQNAMRE